MPSWLRTPAARLATALAPLAERLNRVVPLDLGAISLMTGLRAVLACALPVLLGELTGEYHLSWIAIAAFWGCLADTGGAWSTRLAAMGIFTLIAAFACFVGVLLEGNTVSAVALTLAWCFLCSLARVYGNAAATVGLLLNIALLVTLGVPDRGGLHEALLMAGMTIVGGLWAMLLALGLWRLQPYGPARRAVGACWQAVADYAFALSHSQRQAVDDASWNGLAHERRRLTRERIEAAREVVVATRRGRAGTTDHGLRLLALLADADQVYAALIGLNELLESADGHAPDNGVRRAVRLVIGRLGTRCAELAQRLEGESPRAVDLGRSGARLRQRVDAAGGERVYGYTIELLQQISQWIDAAFDNLEKPQTRQTHLASLVEQAVARRLRLTELVGTLRANLTPDSTAFRHAMRLAVTAAVAVLATRLLDLTRGYWISITAIVVLQPYLADTWRRTLDRIAGSVLGGLIAAELMQLADTPLHLTLMLFPLSLIAFTLRSVNYALYMLCMTPLVVLIAELFQTGGLGDAPLAGLRAAYSVCGGVLGLAASFLLWPRWEAPQLPRQIGAAVRAHRDYLLVVLGAKPDAEDRDIGAARRQSGLSSNNAEASLQRVLSETRLLSKADAEPALIALACLRRMAGATVTLSLLPQFAAGTVQPRQHAELRRWLDSALSDIAQALEQSAAPPPLPAPPAVFAGLKQRAAGASLLESPTETILANELLRLRRQLDKLHEAAVRLGRREGPALQATPEV